MKENSIEEDMKILEGIIKGDEDCINAIYSQMKVKNDNDEDIQYYKKEIQSIKNIVNNYLKEKARADKLEKEYSTMLTELDENECDYKRVLKENEEKSTILLVGAEKVKQLEKENEDLKADNYELNNRITDLLENIPVQKIKDKIKELKKKVEELTDEKGYWGGSDLLEQIKVLEEILEKEQ